MFDMTFSSECGPSNDLLNFMKQFNQDRSLQQDRFGSSSKVGLHHSNNGFRTKTLSSPALSSDHLANDLFQPEESPAHYASSPFLEPPPQNEDAWTQEFQLKTRISTPPPLASYEEFEQHINRDSQSPTTWTLDFQQTNPSQEHMAFQRAFEQIEDEEDRDWDKEFADHEAWEVKARPIPTRSSSHLLDAKDWSVEFSRYDDLARSVGKEHTNNDDDWVQKYQKSLENNNNNNNTKGWQRLQPDYGYRALRPDNETYDYIQNNPYIYHPDAIDQVPHVTLADEIMALEAKSQLFPDDAETWEKLGLKQQENERDTAAITALEKAVAIDADRLDAWLALSVSYTNEHCRMDAYNCLEQWIAHHPSYYQHHNHMTLLLGQHHTDETKRHDYITQLFLDAARRSPEETDPDVQVGLGVLFNMSEEYAKAIDCFKAALVSRPHDYQLWNKVGATLAKAHNSAGAIEMYDTALQINPSFVRARYNLAVSCMNLGHYPEAAHHLLVTLALQRDTMTTTSIHIPNDSTSDGIWDSLRLLMYMMSREDLAPECDRRNLDAFRGQFDF